MENQTAHKVIENKEFERERKKKLIIAKVKNIAGDVMIIGGAIITIGKAAMAIADRFDE